MDKNYFELEVRFDGKNYEKIFEVLYLSGIHNILETENSIVVYFSEKEKNNVDTVTRELLSKKLADKKTLILKMLVNQDWDRNWKKSIKPVFIKKEIIVYPSWLKKSVNKFKNRILIEIDPKMSFGTGHNETTQLVLELMCDFRDTEDKYALDYGCGTAVLAIAAVKQGIKKAVAIDIDEDSIENAREYLKINKAENKIRLYRKDIYQIKEKNFDVVYANILRNVIEKNLGNIYKKLKSGGKLFISGVLAEEDDKISVSLRKNNFRIVDKRYKSEWLGIFAVKE
ncbi:MAG: 50S ribosomal protein L11 methyltransferase [Ignavibacteriae bacterium]|nr:50S ribosomal protein L11 methyltransferase [Ignavibacteriota bacterium]